VERSETRGGPSFVPGLRCAPPGLRGPQPRRRAGRGAAPAKKITGSRHHLSEKIRA